MDTRYRSYMYRDYKVYYHKAFVLISARAPQNKQKFDRVIEGDEAVAAFLANQAEVRRMQDQFLANAANSGADIVLLDIPLLFETGREGEVDVVIVVSAGERLQRERALSRPGMTSEKLAFILSRQVPDAEKKARADYVIDTSVSLADTERNVERVIAEMRSKVRQ